MPLTSRLWNNLLQGGRQDLLVLPNQTFDYADMTVAVRRWLAAFDTAGLSPGDRLVLRSEREEVAIAAALAALVDGIVLVLLDPTCPDTRLSGIVDTTEPGLLVTDAPLANTGTGTRARVLTPPPQLKGLRKLLGKDDNRFGLDLDPAKRAPRLPESDGLAYLLFTSGTTSAPTGVEISRANLAANLTTIARLFDYSNRSRIFNDMILSHADGFAQGPLLAVWTGAALIRAGGFDMHRLEDWLARIRQERATHVLSVPTLWAMIERYAAHDDYFDAPECRMLMTVADKMPPELWQRIETRFGKPLFNHYGLTETVASALYAGDHPEMGRKGSIGLPVDCEARIAGDTEEGELLLRGPNVFHRYWRNADRTRDSFTRDGWFRTGDLVRCTGDGSYAFQGRLKTVIMSGGFLIRPDEVDEAMLRHAAVTESVTLGVADPVFGEIAMTAVVLSQPTAEPELSAHAQTLLEPRKIPKRILVLDKIPRGISGKPRTTDLRDLLARRGNPTEPGGADEDLSRQVMKIAARIFRVPADTLSGRTQPDDLQGWDSFTQLNLVLALEQHFDRTIPPSRVSALRSLGDFVDSLKEPG